MRSARTIFVKQAIDMGRNPMVLVQFVIYPTVALLMTMVIARTDDAIPDTMFITMMAAVFAGMGLVTATAGVIAEDVERGSLRFLIMAGVKPHQYLAGTGGFLLLTGVIVSVLFGMMGSFSLTEFVIFVGVMVSATAASIVLGSAIGLLAKDQQAATAISLPVAVVLGFTPMVAEFNPAIEKAASILYTQQLNVVVNDFSADLPQALLVIGANGVLLIALFVIAYRTRGFKPSRVAVKPSEQGR